MMLERSFKRFVGEIWLNFEDDLIENLEDNLIEI